jgi:hypothetical protein
MDENEGSVPAAAILVCAAILAALAAAWLMSIL